MAVESKYGQSRYDSLCLGKNKPDPNAFWLSSNCQVLRFTPAAHIW